MGDVLNSMMLQLSVMALPFLIAITGPVIVKAYLADAMGDRGPRYDGRLSLDPLRHADPIGTGVFPLISVVFGLPILFGYAKPLHVNPGAFRPKHGLLIYAAAAGVSLILFAIIFALLLRFLGPYEFVSGWVNDMLMAGIQICCFFAFFNLLPIPPNDGAVIITQFLDREQAEKYWSIAPYSFFIILGIILLAPQLILIPVNALLMAVLSLVGFL